MAHTCQMALGDAVSRVDGVQTQLAHRPAARSLYVAVGLVSPENTRAFSLVSAPFLPADSLCPLYMHLGHRWCRLLPHPSPASTFDMGA